MTLELVQAFISGEKDVPDYRVTQGWITFLPVALILKASWQLGRKTLKTDAVGWALAVAWKRF